MEHISIVIVKDKKFCPEHMADMCHLGLPFRYAEQLFAPALQVATLRGTLGEDSLRARPAPRHGPSHKKQAKSSGSLICLKQGYTLPPNISQTPLQGPIFLLN